MNYSNEAVIFRDKTEQTNSLILFFVDLYRDDSALIYKRDNENAVKVFTSIIYLQKLVLWDPQRESVWYSLRFVVSLQ